MFHLLTMIDPQHPYTEHYHHHTAETVTERTRGRGWSFTEIWHVAKISSVSDSACFVLLQRKPTAQNAVTQHTVSFYKNIYFMILHLCFTYCDIYLSSVYILMGYSYWH